MKACLAFLVACGPLPHAQGLVLPSDAQAWAPAIERLVELQAQAWGDPDWPRYLREQLTVSIELQHGPFQCGPVLAAGCTQNYGGLDSPQGVISSFAIWLIAGDDVTKTAIGYELGHVYAATHGIADDDKYVGIFWDQDRQAIDSWSKP